MNKIVVTEFIPRLGNGRPENGTGTQTFQSMRPAEFYSAVSMEGRTTPQTLNRDVVAAAVSGRRI